MTAKSTCIDCKNWEADEFTTLKPEDRSGVCTLLPYTLDIQVTCGTWCQGGYVESDGIETPGDFGCIKWEQQ